MKFWKNWPYWLRGGVIGAIAGIALDIPPLLCYLYVGGFFCINISPMIFAGIFVSAYPQLSNSNPLLWMSIVSIVISFFFGSLIGIIFGLVKKKKSSSI